VALKLCARNNDAIRREIAAYKHIDSASRSLPGSALVRRLLDSFELTGLADQHMCMIHEPLGVSIATFRDVHTPGRRLSEGFLKAVLVHVLQAVDFLHSDAGIVHTDGAHAETAPNHI